MENKEIDFSVVICCYNPDLDKLKKTIISAVKQKDVSLEIIISDDGSKENYLPKLKNWVKANKLTNIKYNFLKENIGTVKNLISGIECSVGKYIKGISPGDYLFNEYSLQRYKTEFEEKNCSVVFSKAVYYNDEGKIFKITNPYMRSSEKNSRYLKRNLCYFMDFILGATMACKREMKKYLDEIKDVVRLLEDYPFSYLTLMKNENVNFIKEYLIWYEYGTGVSTTSSSAKLEKDYENFFKYLRENYSSNKQVLKSLKCIDILRNYKGKLATLKLTLIKPSYFLEKFCVRFLQKYRKFEDVDFDTIHSITTLKNN